jgi:hypothetical protein
MNLQKELCHKSEEIDDAVLLDVVKALRRRVRRVSHDYDIPYIAGYNVDGKTIFIDRHLPRTIRWLLKTVRVEPFLLTHEIVEKALLDELRFTTFMPIRSRRGPNATRSKRQASRGGRTSPS